MSRDDGNFGEFSRRSVLGASALGLAGMAGAPNPTAARVPGDERASSLDSDAGPKSASASSAGSNFVNVKDYGVVGDGVTDDAAAFQDAANAATPHGVLYVPHDVVLHFESTIDLDLDSTITHNRFSFLVDGVLNPGSDLGKAIYLHDASYPYVNVRVSGGGKDIYSDTAVHIERTSFGFFEGSADNYAGRVYHIKNDPPSGDDTAGLNSIGHLHTWNCGQGLAIHNGAGHGEIVDMWESNPVKGPEFVDCADICINQYENYMGADSEQGIVFLRCLSTWADKIAVGGDAPSAIPAEFVDCDHAFVNALHLGGSNTWGGKIKNTKFSTFRVFCNVNEKGLIYTGSETRGNRVVLNGQNLNQKGLVVASDVTDGYHYFTGNIYGTDANAVDVRSSTAEIHFDHFNAYGNAGGDLTLPSGNEVRLSDCRFGAGDVDKAKTVNGLGAVGAPAEKPDATNWRRGDRVLFIDTDDGTGTGLYHLEPGGNWLKVDYTYVSA